MFRALGFLMAGLTVWPAFGQPEALAVLRQNCVVCHNQRSRTSGLSLETREGALTGGNRGPAVLPGDAAASRLIQAVEQSGALKMPPTGRLKDEQIAALKLWVAAGAGWAEGAAGAHRHWAFEPPGHPAPPPVWDTSWVRNPIDQFILARLEREGVRPSAEADRTTLIRRASLDLTGLPPTPAELAAFLADARPDAYERLVDRLLASPHYGERWGRHWLDLARYADSNGYNLDDPRQIWKYRDWVIAALNRDLPFNQFVIEQIAGDLLPNPTTDQLVATGFHRNTPINLEGGIDFEQYRVEAVVDRVATTGEVFLGLTLGCARCHDHKFDPVSQREFYQFYAFFNNIDELGAEKGRDHAYEPLLEFAKPEEIARRDAIRAQLEVLRKELAEYEKDHDKKDAGYKERQATIAEVTKREPRITSTLIMRDRTVPREAYIHVGGDFLHKGERVNPGTPAVLPALDAKGPANRLDLARWLVDPRNPLTARVTINRLWQRYFGKGLVETENDFGTQGAPPSHPELLDWLATEFVARGWSQKAMHRLIVTSAAYRQVSTARPDLKNVDPGNRLLARQSRLRLDAEIVRDASLEASGLLNGQIGGPSVFPPQPDGAMKVGQLQREWKASMGADRYRRGMYTYFWRATPHPALTVFDAPDSTTACTRRNRSNTPLQALTLLNDEGFFEFAQGLASRVLREGPAKDTERIDYAFRLCLARAPRQEEHERLAGFLAGQLDEFRTRPEEARQMAPAGAADLGRAAAWTSLARVLLNLDEFITRE